MERKTIVNNVSVNSVSHVHRCSTCLFLPCVTVSTSVGKLGHGCEGLAEARGASTRNPASSAARVWTLPGAEAPSSALWGLPRPRTVHTQAAPAQRASAILHLAPIRALSRCTVRPVEWPPSLASVSRAWPRGQQSEQVLGSGPWAPGRAGVL